MLFRKWGIPLGSLILLLCAQHGESTLILGSMLMAATAAMTGMVMGPLTVGGLIMMMLMANQQAQQRTSTASSTNAPTVSGALENTQNLLNLLSTLTGAASNLATTTTPVATAKASKRALYSPQNLEELLAQSSRSTSVGRNWQTPPEPRSNDFWNFKPQNYFSPETGFAVEPIPDDLLDIAMRIPRAKSEQQTEYEGGSGGDVSAAYNDMMTPPRPIQDDQLRWVASEPGDLFSSFPEVREEDLLNFVRKRSTRAALEGKFRLEDIANVTRADESVSTKETLSEREKLEDANTRILRQLSALDPLRCLPQLACNLQAAPPSTQSGLLNDYAYLVKTVFTRDDEDDEEDDVSPTSAIKAAASAAASTTKVASDIIFGKTSNRKKNLKYKSPVTKKNATNTDQPESDVEAASDESGSSEETPMDDEELERLMLREQYEMDQMANEELLNDDPEFLPYVLKSASKAPTYLGPDIRRPNPTAPLAAPGAKPGAGSRPGPGARPGSGGSRPPFGAPHGTVPGRPLPPFDAVKYRNEDLERLSSGELNMLLSQVSYPGEDFRMEEEEPSSGAALLSSLIPELPQMSFGFSSKRKTGNHAFDDDPFFEGFKRSMNQQYPDSFGGNPDNRPRLRKVRRVVRRAASPAAGRLAYLRSMKQQLALETDPANVFEIARQVGEKTKSPRQCRFLFGSCPMNSTQLLNMIGNIRTAVLGLSNAQQLLTQRTTPAPDTVAIVGTLATIGPNVVKLSPETAAPSSTTPPPPMPPIHHLQAPAQPHTVILPQIIQVPVPVATHAHVPAPVPAVPMQAAAPYLPTAQSSDLYNMIADAASGSSMGPGGTTSISHELPNGEKLEINMKLVGKDQENYTIVRPQTPAPTTTPSPPPPSTNPPPPPPPPAPQAVISAPIKPPSADDLLDLFDDDRFDNVLLPQKTLIDKEIKAPSGLDSLQAAILAIEKINQAAAATGKGKIRPLAEDDEVEVDGYKISPKLAQLAVSLQKQPLPTKNKKQQYLIQKPGQKKHQKKPSVNDEEGEDDDSSEEDEDEEEDFDEFRRSRLPDPLDPKSRDFIPVPTKTTTFADLEVPATQTFAKKQLQVGANNRRSSNVASASAEGSSEEMLRKSSSVGSSEENYYKRSLSLDTEVRKVRRPRILYPQEDLKEKPETVVLLEYQPTL